MPDPLDVAAEALRASSAVFTRRNLFYRTTRMTRGRGEAMSEAAFEEALRERLSRGELPGLLPSPCCWRWPPAREWDALFPDSILLVDRRAILDLFVASGVIASARLAVVCIDAAPAAIVDWLQRGARAGRRAPVMYLHDAGTVIYPFTFEPLATILENAGAEGLVYSDLGLPPLGCTPRRFGDETLPPDELIVDLEAIPPATLVRYAAATMRDLCRARTGERSASPLPIAADLVTDGGDPRRAR